MWIFVHYKATYQTQWLPISHVIHSPFNIDSSPAFSIVTASLETWERGMTRRWRMASPCITPFWTLFTPFHIPHCRHVLGFYWITTTLWPHRTFSLLTLNAALSLCCSKIIHSMHNSYVKMNIYSQKKRTLWTHNDSKKHHN